MNEQDRSELDRLKRHLESLRSESDALWRQVQELEARLSSRAAPVAQTASPIEPGIARVATELPKPPPVYVPQPEIAVPAVPPASVTPLEVEAPPVIDPTGPLRTDVPPLAGTEPPVAQPSFEMRLGTYWLVRIGIVMLLTALVFFGKYAYQNFIANLGPAGKVALMYLGGGVLLGLGSWLQRRQESLRNYGQVLFAGGLAAVYFTTYAAHHLPTLRIIASPVLDGLLLLAWAGFITFLAERRKSEVLSLFAVGLAYYSAAITQVGLFTLYSNLILTVAAVFFLVRNRWATLSFLSLAATYAGYAFWRFYAGGQWRWATPEEGLWTGNFFLMAYWTVFTAAVFLSRHEKFVAESRAVFLTVNNAAFFTQFVLTMIQVQHGGFWKLCLIYGAVLIGLSILARRVLAGEPIVAAAYLTQGVLLVTVGLIAKFSGLQLALMLAAESTILLTLARLQRSALLQGGSFVTAALAVGWTVDGLKRFDTAGLWLGGGIGIILGFNAWLSNRQNEPPDKPLVRPQPACFAVLAVLVLLATTWNNTSRETFPLVLAAEALVLTASIYVLRVREFALLAQGVLILAQLSWLTQAVPGQLAPWWNPALLLVISVALTHWWSRQRTIPLEAAGAYLFQGIYSLAVVGILSVWLHPRFSPEHWLAFASLLALALTAYGAVTRAWFIALAAQLLMVASTIEFLRQLTDGHPQWFLPLTPMLALTVLSGATVVWFRRSEMAESALRMPLLNAALVYRWAAVLMSLAWVHEYIPARERLWMFASLGAAMFVWSGWRRYQEGLLISGVLALAGLVGFWFPHVEAATVYVPNLLAILLLLVLQQVARRFSEGFSLDARVLNGLIVTGGLTLWLFVSRWVLRQSDGFYLTVAWAVLAFPLFVTGLALRERMYRWLGLAVLGGALARVVTFDVWKLETIYRIASFFALGVVLLVLGFLYIRFQERIKQWL